MTTTNMSQYFLSKGNVPEPTKCDYVSAPLYHVGKNNETRVWRSWSYNNKVYTIHGLLGGQLQVSEKEAKPKNVGRANATTATEQAQKEAEALFQHQLKRKYALTPGVIKFTPMLAKNFDEAKLVFPCHVQPKLDGLRCMVRCVNGKMEFISRSGQTYNLPHLEEALKLFGDNFALDGELYIHGLHLQDIISLVKKAQADTVKLQYWIYDLPISGKWSERLKKLENYSLGIAASSSSKLQRLHGVLTTEVNSLEDIKKEHKFWVSQGFEGLIIRLPDGVYEFGYRSDSLLKYKDFVDDEFEVIGYKAGRGKMEEAVIWVCKTKAGAEFDVNMSVPYEEKERYYKEGDSYIGKFLTVKYFGFSKEGKPRFATGVAFRPSEDLHG